MPSRKLPTPKRSDIPRLVAGVVLAGLAAAAWHYEGRVNEPKELDRPKPSERIAKETQARLGGPAALPSSWQEWKSIVLEIYEAMSQDRLLAVAAGIVFFGLLALFPGITAFVSFYGLFATPSTISDHLALAAGIMPAGAYTIVQEQVARILAKGDTQLSVAFLAGTAVAVWSANAGMKAMMDALNVIYGVPETRGFFRLNAISLALTLGAFALLLAAIAGIVVFPLVMAIFGIDGLTESLVPLLRWPALLVGILLALSVLYRFGPAPHGARWRWITPGSVFAAIAWVLGSGLLSWYLANFANYDATYGSLGAAMGLMMWMWMSSTVVLLGAQFNVVLDRRAAQAASLIPADNPALPAS
jgi:membrane protein